MVRIRRRSPDAHWWKKNWFYLSVLSPVPTVHYPYNTYGVYYKVLKVKQVNSKNVYKPDLSLYTYMHNVYRKRKEEIQRLKVALGTNFASFFFVKNKKKRASETAQRQETKRCIYTPGYKVEHYTQAIKGRLRHNLHFSFSPIFLMRFLLSRYLLLVSSTRAASWFSFSLLTSSFSQCVILYTIQHKHLISRSASILAGKEKFMTLLPLIRIYIYIRLQLATSIEREKVIYKSLHVHYNCSPSSSISSS